MLLDLNPYNEKYFRESFSKTNIYKKLEEEADYISWGKNLQDFTSHLEYTPRWYNVTKIYSLSSFYYLNFITERADNELIYDIGCGNNWFKQYIPNIIGLDQRTNPNTIFFADQEEIFDDNWLKRKVNAFKYAFSICALHFIPLSMLSERVNDFINTIKVGGVGYLSLNAVWFLRKESPEKLIELFGNTDFNRSKLETYVRDKLHFITETVTNLLCVDIDFKYHDEWIDGNIRIVFER